MSRLSSRYKNAKLPTPEIIDLNKHELSKQSWISKKTIEKVKGHLEKGDQVLFFLNRRGFSPFVFCKKCLKVFACPNCSINLVYHKIKKNLLCHYCGHNSSLARECKKKCVRYRTWATVLADRLPAEAAQLRQNEANNPNPPRKAAN